VTGLPVGRVPPDAGHLEVALATAAGGWPVFPCLHTKRPATEHGFKDAVTDPDRIRGWWNRHPDHLVAIPTEGLVVVDLDWRPPAPCPWGWWQETCEAHGWDWAANLLGETPGNGVHVYWQAPPDVDVRNTTNLLGSRDHSHLLVDIRASGGYVIAPGSRLADGREYSLLNLVPELPTAPAWLIELIAKARGTGTADQPQASTVRAATPLPDQRGTPYGLKALEGELGRLATAPKGQRNDSLNRAAHALGQLTAGGQVDPVHAASRLEAVALRTGLALDEVQRTIRSGMAAGARAPRRPAA
jgi:Bifunctional DNA primase/polymerase, N-terminal